MDKIHISLFIVAAIFLFNCSDNSKESSEHDATATAIYADEDGIVSIEAENFSSAVGWSIKNYYTGIGILPDSKSDLNSEVYATYDIKISSPGSFYLYTLGNRKRNTPIKDNIIQYTILNDEEKVISHVLSGFLEINAPVWSSVNMEQEGAKLKIDFPKKGIYTLKVLSYKGFGYYLDKIVLSSDPEYQPHGTGPEPTCIGCEQGKRDKIVLPPQWAFGVLYGGYTDHNQTINVIDTLINGDFPIDAYWIDSYFWDFNEGEGPKGYIDFIGDTVAFPDMKKLWGILEEKKIKSGIWIWNLIQETGNEKAYNEFNDLGYFSNTYKNTNGWHNETKNTMTGSIDFDNPDAVAYWKEKLKPFFDKGLDFLKLDNSSDIDFCSAAFSATQEMGKETKGRGFILAHVHTTYDYRHKLYPTKWSGDAKIAWTQPDYPNLYEYAMGGLKENIGMVADPKRSTYEIPFLSHDAGGYNYFGSMDQSPELYTRWIQFASMNSIMMFFSSTENPTRNHPYRYSETVQDNFRKYTHMRMRLFPYLYSYAINSHLTGEKMIQGVESLEYQYLLGNEILVAPVFEKGAITKKISLPKGEWIDPETKQVYTGSQEITLDAPLSKLPLLFRMGAIIPLRNYARAIELGSNDTLTLEAYPSEEISSFDFYEDDGLSNEYLEGKIAKSSFSLQHNKNGIQFIINPVSGDFSGMKEDRFYVLHINLTGPPKKVNLNDKDEGFEWSYLKDKAVLEIKFHASKFKKQVIKVKI